MRRLQKDITMLWNTLGAEGQGEELKLAAHHCLLGVQDTLSHPQDYTLLNKLAASYQDDKGFQAFKAYVESGDYEIHFLLDMERKGDDQVVYLTTIVERADRRSISPEIKSNIEEWAAKIGYDTLKSDIERIKHLSEA